MGNPMWSNYQAKSPKYHKNIDETHDGLNNSKYLFIWNRYRDLIVLTDLMAFDENLDNFFISQILSYDEWSFPQEYGEETEGWWWQATTYWLLRNEVNED